MSVDFAVMSIQELQELVTMAEDRIDAVSSILPTLGEAQAAGVSVQVSIDDRVGPVMDCSGEAVFTDSRGSTWRAVGHGRVIGPDGETHRSGYVEYFPVPVVE